MFTKKQSEHPQKVFQVFQVFRVFQVFHVRFWTTKPPDFGPNPNKHVKPIGSSYRHIMATENTQKANSPTGLRTRYCPVCDSHSSFSAKRFFSGGEVAKRGAKPAIGDGISWATPCKRSRSLKRSLETAAARVMSLGGSVVAKVSDYTQASVSDSSEVPSHCCP